MTDTIPSIFSDHNGMKIEINSRRKTGKFTNMWKLNKFMKKTVNQRMKLEEKLDSIFETKYNIQKLTRCLKAVLSGKFIEIQAFFFKKQINRRINQDGGVE